MFRHPSQPRPESPARQLSDAPPADAGTIDAGWSQADELAALEVSTTVKDDDRPSLTVTGMDVEEGSRATFTVTRSGATEAATLIDLALSNVDTEAGDFDATTYEWSTNGTTWTDLWTNTATVADASWQAI